MSHQFFSAFRYLIRHRRHSFAAVAPLALGLGVAIAAMALLEQLFFGPLGVPEPEKIVHLQLELPALGGTAPFSAAAFLHLAEGPRSSVAALAAVQRLVMTMTGAGEPLRLNVASVTPSFFDLAAVAPLVGRPLRDEDARLSNDATRLFGNGRYVVLSERLWRNELGGDDAAVGRMLELDGAHYEVVGVMPSALMFPPEIDAWIPLGFGAKAAEDYGGFYFEVFARRAERSEERELKSDLQAISARLRPAAPRITQGLGIEQQPLREYLLGDRREPLVMLFGLALLIVLAVTSNTGQLQLAAVARRRRELALRLALGAEKSRVMRQLTLEGLMLTAAGLLGGFVLAAFLLEVGTRSAPLGSGFSGSLELTGKTLGLAVILASCIGLFIGWIPAFLLRESRLLQDLLQDTNQVAAPRGHQRFQSAFTVAQVSLALVLVTSGFVLAKSFFNLMETPLGFQPEGLVTIDMQLPSQRYKTEKIRNFVDAALDDLRKLPGVIDAGTLMRLPILDSGGGVWFRLPEQKAGEEDAIAATFNPISPRSFEVLKQPLLAGREFTREDRAGGEPVAIVDEELARRYFSGASPIGQVLVLTPWPDERRRIVGVVGSVSNGGLRTDPMPTIYVPFDQLTFGRLRIVVRSTTAPPVLLPLARKVLWQLDPDLAFDVAASFDSRLAELRKPDLWALRLVGFLSVIGLVLVAGCLYGTTSYLISQRWRELGIRLALGSSPRDLIARVVLGRLLDIALGLTLGILALFSAREWLASVLFKVNPVNPWLVTGGCLAITVIALGALYLSARRVSRIDPMTAIR